MIIDLIILTIVGCVIEIIGMIAFNKMLYASVMGSACSLLIMLIATTRWQNKGLFIAPFLALATVLSGKFLVGNPAFAVNYDWKLYIAIVLSLLSFGVNFFWFKKFSYKRTFVKEKSKIFLLVFIDIIVSQLVLSLAYLALKHTFQLFGFLAWNSFSFAILAVGAFVLAGQGVLVNVKEDLIESKKQMEETTSFNFDDLDEDIFVKKEGELKNE